MKIVDRIEQWDIGRLLPYAKNSRTHSEEQIAQIAASIKAFGFTNPILVGDDGVIVAGHGRLSAARKLGLKQVPVIVLDHLSDTERRALVIADNKLALNAGWDEELLAIEFADLRDEDFDLSLTGFSDEELKKLIIDAEEIDMPDLADGDREPLQQMAFILHDEQAEIVKSALSIAKKMGDFINTGNENINGNALARVCELFIGKYGNR